jgi:hypothetical protein
MTPEQVEARRRLRDDFAFYAKHALKIRTKDGEIQPLVLNDAQRYFLSRVEEQLAATGRVRAIILKGRQQGISTVVGGRLIFRTSQHKARKALVVAHKADSTRALFDMTRRYYENLPDLLKPQTKYSSRAELVFDALESGYMVATAGGDGIARGETLQYLHLSEVAFWPKNAAQANFNSLIQAVPETVGTEVYIESTANGVTGVFADLWRGAVAGENGFIPVFIPWFWQKEYRAPVPKGFERTPDEQKLVDLYGLDNKQLVWRRKKVAQNGLELFKQEYPCTPEEAFLTTGRPVFDQDRLADKLREVGKPIRRESMNITETDFEPDPRGDLYVYAEPQLTDTYTIGADVAMGVRGGDFSVAQVLDGKRRLVATYRGHIHPDLFARVLYVLGRRYNDALVSAEVNNHGLLTNVRLSKDLNYPNVYQTVVVDHVLDRETTRVGFETNSKTKPMIVDLLRAAFRDGQIDVSDRQTLEEMRAFIVTEDGKLEAEPGYHDDTVLALAIANYCHQEPWVPVPVADEDYIEAL